MNAVVNADTFVRDVVAGFDRDVASQVETTHSVEFDQRFQRGSNSRGSNGSICSNRSRSFSNGGINSAMLKTTKNDS